MNIWMHVNDTVIKATDKNWPLLLLHSVICSDFPMDLIFQLSKMEFGLLHKDILGVLIRTHFQILIFKLN